MKKFLLSEAGARGWFIGDFDGAVVRTKDFEVCYQSNPKGSFAPVHYHRVITELQLITRGRIRMHGHEFVAGDIVMLEPNEINDTEYLEDTDCVAIKFPSVPEDKYSI